MSNILKNLKKVMGLGLKPNPHFCYVKELESSNKGIDIFKFISKSSAPEGVSIKGKTWSKGTTIKIAFLNGSFRQQSMVKKYSVQWIKNKKYPVDLEFSFIEDRRKADVRISFDAGKGSWSYLGTDATYVSSNKPTMNFGWLDKQVILHEFGHMLGLSHEHSHPLRTFDFNRKSVMKDVSKAPNNWSYKMAYNNIFKKLNETSTLFSRFDPKSIMLYFYPAKWTKNNKATNDNQNISQLDFEFVSKLYS